MDGLQTIEAFLAVAERGSFSAAVRFQQRYPEVAIDLTLDDRFVDPVGDGHDPAIRIGRLEDGSPMARRLGTFTACRVAAPGRLERHAIPAHPRDLAAHDCLRCRDRRRPEERRFPRAFLDALVHRFRRPDGGEGEG